SLCRRRGQAAVLGLGVSVPVFALGLLSGDPALLMASPAAPPEVVTTTRHVLGFDRPLYEQFGRYLGNALQGNLGVSLRMNRPVTTLILERLPATLQLTVAAVLIEVVGAIPEDD